MITMLAALATAAQSYVADARPVRLSQRQINRIAAECRVPRSWMQRRSDGVLRVHVPPNARYQSVDCVLQRTRLQGPPMGFIGNERR